MVTTATAQNGEHSSLSRTLFDRARPPVSSVGTAFEQDDCLKEATANLRWYSAHAWRARVCYQALEVFQIATGAMIPLAAAVHWPIAITASLGAAIAVAGGLRSAFRWQGNWIAWSITAAKMQREISLYRIHAAPYGGANAGQRLVKTVTDLEVGETVQWAGQAQQANQPTTAPQTTGSQAATP